MDIERVTIPVSLLQKMAEAAQMLEAFQNEMEDYLLSQDAAFLTRMRQARSHHLEGETRPLDALKQEPGIERPIWGSPLPDLPAGAGPVVTSNPP